MTRPIGVSVSPSAYKAERDEMREKRDKEYGRVYNLKSVKKDNYYPYRAFGGQNKIVYSTGFVTRRAIILS